MRTRFLPAATLLPLALSGLVAATAGCDDGHTGQLPEVAGPPLLMHVLVQDERPRGGRGIASDLINTTPGRPCDIKNPCDAPVQCGTRNGESLEEPSTLITNGGNARCHDVNSVLETKPPIGLVAAAGGSSVRVVFNKLLDPTIEKVTFDSAGAATYQLPATTLQIIGPDGKAIALAKGSPYYDVIGTPKDTSDPVINPYGPALVAKPAAPLTVNTTYTIKLDPSNVKARDGKPYTGATSWPFTTEGLFVLQSWNCPTSNCPGLYGSYQQPDPVATPSFDYESINFPDTSDPTASPSVAQNDVLQFLVNADVDPTSFNQVNVKDSTGKNIPIEVFQDTGNVHALIGGDPTMCPAQLNARAIDIVPASAPGKPMMWPMGSYTVTLQGIKDNDTGKTTIMPLMAKFTVVVATSCPADNKTSCAASGDVKTDPFVFTTDPMNPGNTLLPEQCHAAPDMMAPPPGDMTVPHGMKG